MYGHIIYKTFGYLCTYKNCVGDIYFETTAFHSSMVGGQSGICCAQKPSSRGMLSVKSTKVKDFRLPKITKIFVEPLDVLLTFKNFFQVCDWWFLTNSILGEFFN